MVTSMQGNPPQPLHLFVCVPPPSTEHKRFLDTVEDEQQSPCEDLRLGCILANVFLSFSVSFFFFFFFCYCF